MQLRSIKRMAFVGQPDREKVYSTLNTTEIYATEDIILSFHIYIILDDIPNVTKMQ